MDERFPDRMQRARKIAGISQEKAAEVSGVSRAMISRYETGEMEPKVTPLTELARAYGVSPTWLLTGIEPLLWNPAEEVATYNQRLIQSLRLAGRWMLEAADSGLASLVSSEELATDREDQVDGADTREARPDDEVEEG